MHGDRFAGGNQMIITGESSSVPCRATHITAVDRKHGRKLRNDKASIQYKRDADRQTHEFISRWEEGVHSSYEFRFHNKLAKSRGRVNKPASAPRCKTNATLSVQQINSKL